MQQKQFFAWCLVILLPSCGWEFCYGQHSDRAISCTYSLRHCQPGWTSRPWIGRWDPTLWPRAICCLNSAYRYYKCIIQSFTHYQISISSSSNSNQFNVFRSTCSGWRGYFSAANTILESNIYSLFVLSLTGASVICSSNLFLDSSFNNFPLIL